MLRTNLHNQRHPADSGAPDMEASRTHLLSLPSQLMVLRGGEERERTARRSAL